MKHYRRLWKESPGAMTLLHVIVVGVVVSAALVGRSAVKSLAALVATGLVAWVILPACVAWNVRRTRK